ncbi:DoxX family protein [Fulvivirgaceae bacterium BMA12]|uniref:DoxX family protein n=1 Tax=Agaribacillus aureus TaxID=3051825 RepID=A0ABT8L5I8_9BACT|nr:DoxX family protein [Fulvivirgaceae bacterium BMA12]
MFNTQKIEQFLGANKHIGILLLRIFVGGRLCYGVIDNVLSWERMIEFSDFLKANDFLFPTISALVSVYVQFIGAMLISFGFKIRIASFLLTINFLVALLFVHFPANDTVEGMTPALAMLFGCLTLLFTGAEKISLENYLRSK